MSIEPGELMPGPATPEGRRIRIAEIIFPSVGDPVLLPGADQLRAIVEGESPGT